MMTTFLDLIPIDIHDHIAYHLFSSIECDTCDYLTERFGLIDDEYLKTLLEYAKNSTAHLRAVMSAMSHCLYAPSYWRGETVVDWISATASQLRELNLLAAPSFSFTRHSPKLSELRRAAITIAPEQLSLIRGCPNLSELRVFVNCTRRWDYFVSTIAFLPVKSLDIAFSTFSENETSQSQLDMLSKSDLMSFRAACSTLESLFFNPAGKSITTDAWDTFQGLPSLKTLAVRGMDITNEGNHIPFIQSLPEIELFKSLGIHQALRFGAAVKLFELFTPTSYEDILGLRYLPNIRKIRIVLQQGAEEALIGRIGSVEALYLSWLFEYEFHPLEAFDGNPQALFYPVYHEPDITILETIMKTTKKLKGLRIEDAILSSDALERILAIVGHKLEKLEICHDWQKEVLPERMERILKAVIHYCPKLKSLMFIENSTTARYFIISTESQNKRCLQALEQLISARPGFNSYRILRNIIEHRFAIQRPYNMLLWDDIVPN